MSGESFFRLDKSDRPDPREGINSGPYQINTVADHDDTFNDMGGHQGNYPKIA